MIKWAMLVAALLAVAATAEEGEVVVVPLDSCSYEALLYAKERGWLDLPIVMPAGLRQIAREKVALVAAYPPEPQIEEAVLAALGGSEPFASSDLLGLASPRIVSSELLRRFCDEGDEESLRQALEPLTAKDRQSLMSMILFSAAVGLGVAALAYREVSGRLAETGAIIAVFFMRLRRRGVLSKEEIESHPIRGAILEALRTSPQSFSDLQRKTGVGRAVLEWHLGTLKAYGMIIEKRVGKARVYALLP